MRYGLNAELVMNTEGKTRVLRDELQEWIEKLQPVARRLGYQRHMACLAVLIKNGTSFSLMGEELRLMMELAGGRTTISAPTPRARRAVSSSVP